MSARLAHENGLGKRMSAYHSEDTCNPKQAKQSKSDGSQTGDGHESDRLELLADTFEYTMDDSDWLADDYFDRELDKSASIRHGTQTEQNSMHTPDKHENEISHGSGIDSELSGQCLLQDSNKLSHVEIETRDSFSSDDKFNHEIVNDNATCTTTYAITSTSGHGPVNKSCDLDKDVSDTVPLFRDSEPQNYIPAADPLYRDCCHIADLFPEADQTEVYAYLEAHHNKTNRRAIVIEELLHMASRRYSQEEADRKSEQRSKADHQATEVHVDKLTVKDINNNRPSMASAAQQATTPSNSVCKNTEQVSVGSTVIAEIKGDKPIPAEHGDVIIIDQDSNTSSSDTSHASKQIPNSVLEYDVGKQSYIRVQDVTVKPPQVVKRQLESDYRHSNDISTRHDKHFDDDHVIVIDHVNTSQNALYLSDSEDGSFSDKLFSDVEAVNQQMVMSVDPNLIYDLLEQQKNKGNRVDIVLAQLQGRDIPRSPSPPPPVPVTTLDNNDVLQGDILMLRGMFPSFSKAKIYELLTSHLNDANRIGVVVDELLQIISMEADLSTDVVNDTQTTVTQTITTVGDSLTNGSSINGGVMAPIIDTSQIYVEMAEAEKTTSSKSDTVHVRHITDTGSWNITDTGSWHVTDTSSSHTSGKPVSKSPGTAHQNSSIPNAHISEVSPANIAVSQQSPNAEIIAATISTVSGNGMDGTSQEQLFTDLQHLTSVFPGADKDLIFKRLEELKLLNNRIDLISGEMFGETEVVPIAIVTETSDVNDHAGTSSTSANRSEYDVMLDSSDELKTLFPDCDPNYIFQQLDAYKSDPNAVQTIASQLLENKNYPKQKDNKETDQKSAYRNKLHNLTLDMPEFLQKFPDPVQFFYAVEKVMTKNYIDHAVTELLHLLPKARKKFVEDTLAKHNNHFTPALRDIQKQLEEVKGLSGKEKRDAGYDKNFCKKVQPRKLQLPDEPHELFFQELLFTRHEEEIIGYLKEQVDSKAARLESARINGELHECACCYDDEVLFEDMGNCEDGHLFCHECICRSSSEIVGQGRFTFPCLTAECKHHFAINLLKDILPSSMLSSVLRRLQEEELRQADIPDLVSCPHCSFAMVMPDENQRVFSCRNPDCLKETCRFCKEPNHIPLRCEEVEKLGETNLRTYIENKMTEAMLRTCFSCKKKFYKLDGCNKMVCTCGARMCYVCRAPNIDYDHFNHGCPIQSSEVALHEKEMTAAGTEAKQTYAHEHPEVENIKLKYDPLTELKNRPASTSTATIIGNNPGFAIQTMALAQQVMYHQQHQYHHYHPTAGQQHGAQYGPQMPAHIHRKRRGARIRNNVPDKRHAAQMTNVQIHVPVQPPRAQMPNSVPVQAPGARMPNNVPIQALRAQMPNDVPVQTPRTQTPYNVRVHAPTTQIPNNVQIQALGARMPNNIHVQVPNNVSIQVSMIHMANNVCAQAPRAQMPNNVPVQTQRAQLPNNVHAQPQRAQLPNSAPQAQLPVQAQSSNSK